MNTKLHKNKHGKWVACGATVRACRYGADLHKVADVSSTENNNGVGFPENQVNVAKGTSLPAPVGTVPSSEISDEPVVDDDGSISYIFDPNRLEGFKKNIEKANRRLERAGIEERFEYTTEDTLVYDEETGNSYRQITAVLNRPVIRNGDWAFVGSLDAFTDEEGNQVITANSVNGESIEGNFETEDAVRCDHCGHMRRRNRTYVVRNGEGEYKQVGSNCLQAFLGVRPAGLWALEQDVVDEKVWRRDTGVGFNPNFMMVPTRNIVALGLAMSNGGKDYVGTSYENTTFLPTKHRVSDFISGKRNKVDANVDPGEYLDDADKMIKDTVFDNTEDYGRNMQTLLNQPMVPLSKVGFVVSVIPAFQRQFVAKNKIVKEKAKGFLGEPKDVVTDIPNVTVEKVIPFTSNYGYHPVTGHMYIMRTSDNKVIKWATTSSNEILNKVEVGSVLDIGKLTVKRTGEAYGEDQTEVKNLKFTLNE